MVVRVKYVFGLARGHDGRDEIRLELPGGTTVFEAMQRLGVSALELHAAVNGESAPDGTVLRDGDEVTLIPAIQGGGGAGSMSWIAIVFVAGLTGTALAALSPPDAAAQGRVVVPIIVPRPAPSAPGQITIQGSPQPAGTNRPAPAVQGGTAVPSASREVKITTPGGPTTRVTIESVPPTGAGRSGPPPASGGASTPSYASETHVTVRQNAGPGTPETTTERLRIYSNGGVETPVIVLPE